eukprot:TRINITY_DN19737_c0_g1_i1.p2 TRINITY_DN19737_c0_g1~~TRINITY_DN19737_c0_g1_i1.p2  ORF type:complete len:119 (+),score=0.84 TRINITY_DN19737_c0_g1_i1:45-401(+)
MDPEQPSFVPMQDKPWTELTIQLKYGFVVWCLLYGTACLLTSAGAAALLQSSVITSYWGTVYAVGASFALVAGLTCTMADTRNDSLSWVLALTMVSLAYMFTCFNLLHHYPPAPCCRC